MEEIADDFQRRTVAILNARKAFLFMSGRFIRPGRRRG
jgi:hypothetical protein